MWRVLSEKGCVGGVIWRYDDVEEQYVLYFHVEGNKVYVSASLFFVFIVMSSYSNILDMYNFAKWMQYYNLPVKSLSLLNFVNCSLFSSRTSVVGENGWLYGPIKRAAVEDAPPRMGPTFSRSINSLDSAQRFHNKASLCKDNNTSMPHL